MSFSVKAASPGSGIGSPIARREASRKSRLMPLRSATSSAVKLRGPPITRSASRNTSRPDSTLRRSSSRVTPCAASCAQQRQALLAFGALQPVEQALRREVDLLALHRAASL